MLCKYLLIFFQNKYANDFKDFEHRHQTGKNSVNGYSQSQVVIGRGYI